MPLVLSPLLLAILPWMVVSVRGSDYSLQEMSSVRPGEATGHQSRKFIKVLCLSNLSAAILWFAFAVNENAPPSIDHVAVLSTYGLLIVPLALFVLLCMCLVCVFFLPGMRSLLPLASLILGVALSHWASFQVTTALLYHTPARPDVFMREDDSHRAELTTTAHLLLGQGYEIIYGSPLSGGPPGVFSVTMQEGFPRKEVPDEAAAILDKFHLVRTIIDDSGGSVMFGYLLNRTYYQYIYAPKASPDSYKGGDYRDLGGGWYYRGPWPKSDRGE